MVVVFFLILCFFLPDEATTAVLFETLYSYRQQSSSNLKKKVFLCDQIEQNQSDGIERTFPPIGLQGRFKSLFWLFSS